MKNSFPALSLLRRCAIFMCACLAGVSLFAQYRPAESGYHYEFPRDYFSHPDFQTEWWYYTGNLQTPDGHHFGFELTFFRQAVDRDAAKKAAWDVHDIYFAHLALSDLEGGSFYHTERSNRAGPGIAGSDEFSARIWNGNWQIRWKDGDQVLQAIDPRFELHFTLRSEKPPVIHGENGVSQKSAGAGRASHYISLTRIATAGTISLNGKNFQVTGLSWMDHEFFSQQLDENQVGWDWLSLQLADNTELMLFHIRRKDGSIDPYSAGTFIDSAGHTTHLRSSDFVLQPDNTTWRSPATSAVYPIHWKIAIPSLGIELQQSTKLPSQELSGKGKFAPNYWEGAISLAGTKNGQALSGVGYLEMTGYDRAVQLQP